MQKTKHHFVPQFYLRNFSEHEGSICLVNIPNVRAVQHASIRGQCYRQKFYGETDKLENVLAQFEAESAPVIRSVIQGQPVHRYSKVHSSLLDFLALQFLRTRAAVEMATRMASLFTTHLAQESLWSADKNASNRRVIVNPGVDLPLSCLPDYIQATADLDIRVLRVACAARFITSDSPVVAYNQWCEGITHEGVTGTASRGLQIFFPLSPRCLLMLFDESVYSVDGEKTREVVIAHPRDVYKLNRLQAVFAQENILFSEWSDSTQLLDLIPKIAEIRKDNQVQLGIATSETTEPESQAESELLHQYTQMPNVHLKLTFSELYRRAQKIPLGERSRFYRHRIPPLDDDEALENLGRIGTKRFVLKSTQNWLTEWGNIIP